LDLEDKNSISNFSKNISHHTVDILVNNAGIMEESNVCFSDLDISLINKTIEVNTLGPMRLTQLLTENLIKANNGKVFFITSKMGSIEDNSSGGYYGYRLSKTALNMFCRSFAIDHPEIVTAVLHPGWVKTDMGGPNATTTIAESATGLSNFMLRANKNLSGRFFDFRERELPW
jgi:short-subunit dehydrogenase